MDDQLMNNETFYQLCQQLLLDRKNSTGETRILSEFMRPTPVKVWGIGLAFITLVCFCAAVGIVLLPVIGKRNYSRIITWFIGLGVGSLSGTAVFQLLPEVNLLSMPTRAICGIYGFFIIDSIIKITSMFSSEKKLFKFDGTIASVAWMIIFGDGFHNLIDGVSIGAAFTNNIMSGISVAIAVICEEFPHELGDVAILLNSGMSPRQTLVFNLLSASTIYVGFVIGVLAGEVKDASSFVFAFAGGMFLYISLANMIPEMHEKFEATVSEDINQGIKVFILQTSGVMVGLGCMFVLAMFGQDIDLNN
ncbi:unnamed protein product [Soboliphyme baturini]|uniref:Zinc transporter ZIP8 n=1 Tax=Soboliphyme baturini TaxID=241478 RepID=A0A183IMF2_9BILA|nr:unnamed protein product [Soboliphyme baturini]